MNAPSLHIRRWQNDYRVPTDHGAPEQARAELDGIAGRLAEELAAGLPPWFSGEAEAVILVKRLSFDCELDLSRAPELLAARWARRFARALIEAVEFGEEGVLRFPSPAAYRARYIADLAGGSGGAWYYRPFAGLAALPAAGAIRSVLLEDPVLGRETLAALPREAWSRLGTALTCRESRRILEGLSIGRSLEEAEPSALSAWYREVAPQLPPAPWFVTALYLFAAALGAGFSPGPPLALWVRLAARLPPLAGRPEAAELAEALRKGEAAALAMGDSEPDAESWAALAARPNGCASLAEVLRAEIRRQAGSPRPAGEAVHTAFGGLVLLLPELDGLLDEAVCGALPPADPGSARNLIAWLVLAHCAGRSLAMRYLGEAFWRELFGVPDGFDGARLRCWLAEADPAPAAARLAERAAALARGVCLPVPLRLGEQRWTLWVDPASGTWCEMRKPTGQSFDLASGAEISSSFRSTATVAGWAKSDRPCPSFSELRWARCALPILPPGFRPDLSPEPAASGGCFDPIPAMPWRARLAAARRGRADWSWLAMEWGLPAAWQRLLTQLAQIVLRRFAYGIPGSAGASLPYVHGNFLAGCGSLDLDSGCLRLARPPLHVLLNLTGIGRGAVLWSGPPERRLHLDYGP